MKMSGLQVCVKSRGVGRAVLWDSVRLNFLSLRRSSTGMFLKIQIDISSQCKWAHPDLSCYMLDFVHFACKLKFCLPESYLPVISVRICKNVHARPGPEAGHRPASGLCGSLNLRGLPSMTSLWASPGWGLTARGVALGCVSKAPWWGGEGIVAFSLAQFAVFTKPGWLLMPFDLPDRDKGCWQSIASSWHKAWSVASM